MLIYHHCGRVRQKSGLVSFKMPHSSHLSVCLSLPLPAAASAFFLAESKNRTNLKAKRLANKRETALIKENLPRCLPSLPQHCVQLLGFPNRVRCYVDSGSLSFRPKRAAVPAQVEFIYGSPFLACSNAPFRFILHKNKSSGNSFVATRP